MNKFLGNKKAIAVFVMPALLLFGGILFFSLGSSLYYSTLDWKGIGKGTFIGFRNYMEMFQSPIFRSSVWNSLLLAALSVCIQLPLALVLALVLTSKIKGAGFYRTVYFIPNVISSVVIGQLWLKIFNPNYGALNQILRGLGLESWTRNWLGDVHTAMICVIAVIIWQNFGSHMLLAYTAIKQIPQDIYESAELDGAVGVKRAFSITIPLIMPTIKTSAILIVTGSLKAFDMIYVLTNGGPVNSTEVPSSVMFTNIFVYNRYGYGSAIAIFIVVECIVIALALQKLVNTKPIEF